VEDDLVGLALMVGRRLEARMARSSSERGDSNRFASLPSPVAELCAAALAGTGLEIRYKDQPQSRTIFPTALSKGAAGYHVYAYQTAGFSETGEGGPKCFEADQIHIDQATTETLPLETVWSAETPACVATEGSVFIMARPGLPWEARPTDGQSFDH
jgi:hypothetical protein